MHAQGTEHLLAAGPRFRDRTAAGRALARALRRYQGRNTLVLGIPRGGVTVAAAIARRLSAGLDIVVARKLGAPMSAELAIGAVTADGGRYLNEEIIRELGVSRRFVAQVTAEQTREAQRREARLRGPRPKPPLEGRVVVVVDDGLATGATMRAAVQAVRAARPGRLVVAVPVGPLGTCAELRAEADEVVCLFELDPFWAVGLYYEDFRPVDDAEVQRILGKWQAGRRGPGRSPKTVA